MPVKHNYLLMFEELGRIANTTFDVGLCCCKQSLW